MCEKNGKIWKVAPSEAEKFPSKDLVGAFDSKIGN